MAAYIVGHGFAMAYQQLGILITSAMFQKNLFFPGAEVDYMFWAAFFAPLLFFAYRLDNESSSEDLNG